MKPTNGQSKDLVNVQSECYNVPVFGCVASYDLASMVGMLIIIDSLDGNCNSMLFALIWIS